MTFCDHSNAYTIGGLRYAVREAGPRGGRPLLLLHGLADTGASFAPLVDAIEACQPGRYRYIAPDWRGHGATAWAGDDYWFPCYLADLAELIRATAGDRAAILIGHSMGGQIASQFAGLRPERVSRLITLDSLNVPDAKARDAPRRYRRWLDGKRSAPRPWVYANLDRVAHRVARRYPELGRDQHYRLARQWSFPHDDRGRRRMHFDPWHRVPFPYGFRAEESMAIWREVAAPVLCIDGANSPARRLVPAADMARRRACFANLRRVLIDGCGHMLHLQAPARIAAEIHDFLLASAP